MVDDDVDGGDVLVKPSEASYDTDEYSGDDEDATEERDLNRHLARQLCVRANVQGRISFPERDSEYEDVSETFRDARLSSDVVASQQQKSRRSLKRHEKWTKGNTSIGDGARA